MVMQSVEMKQTFINMLQFFFGGGELLMEVELTENYVVSYICDLISRSLFALPQIPSGMGPRRQVQGSVFASMCMDFLTWKFLRHNAIAKI